ncbi:MAG: PAS domain-containing protein [Candidatus Hydrothermarchaeales archaeon]
MKDITERKRAEEALRESEEKYRNIFDKAPVSIILLDKDGQIVDINPWHITHIGKGRTTKKDYLGKNIVTHPSIVKAGLSETYAGVLKGEPFDLKDVYFPTTTGGTDAYFNVTGVPLFKEGKIIGAITIHEDITERKRTEEVLLQERQKLEEITSHVGCGLLLLDEQTKVTYANKVAEEWFGPFQQIGGKFCWEVFKLRDPEKECAALKVLRTGETVRSDTFTEMLHGEETFFYVVASPIKDSDGKIRQITEVIIDITERKKMEEAVRESEERYRSLINDVLDTSAVGIFILDADFRVVWVNKALQRYFGLLSDKVIGKDKRQLIRERIKDIFEDPETFAEKLLATYDTNTYIEHFECHVLPDSDREERWLEHWSQPIRSGLYVGGRIEHYTDITERKKAEEALQESEERFRQFFENEPEYCYMISPEGIILNVNKAALKVLGYRKEELVGKPLKAIYVPESLLKIKQIFAKWKKTGKLKDEEMVIITKKGHRRTVLLSADVVKDKDGRILHSISVQRDITERKKAEQVLKETRAFLDNIIQSAPDAIITVDLEDRITSFSPGAEELFGYKTEDIIGDSVFRLYPQGREKRRKEWKERLLKGEDVRVETKQVKSDGGVIDVKLSMAPLRDGKGDIAGIVGISHDITERKRAEEELNRKMEELERFTKLAVGRELKMVELKKRIKDLEEKLEGGGGS